MDSANGRVNGRRDPARRELGRIADEQLLALVARADYDAFTELYSRYERIAYGLALRILRNHSLAEDAVVESMVGVWRSASKYDDGRGSARTWILTFVHRRAVDLVRREERHRMQSDVPDVADEGTSGGDEAFFVSEERLRVQQALREIPDRERKLLELAYYGGYTQSQLSTALGISLGTVKSRMLTGLSRLRELLEEPEPATPLVAAVAE